MLALPSRQGASPHLGGGRALLARHYPGAVVDTLRLTWTPPASEGASPLLGGGPMGTGNKQEQWRRAPLSVGAVRQTGRFAAFVRR